METEKTRQDYELGQVDGYQIPRLNKDRKQVYIILKKDALDSHWITLYNKTIYKNFGIFKILYNLTAGKEVDYTKIYNFFVANQLHPYFVLPVRVLIID